MRSLRACETAISRLQWLLVCRDWGSLWHSEAWTGSWEADQTWTSRCALSQIRPPVPLRLLSYELATTEPSARTLRVEGSFNSRRV